MILKNIKVTTKILSVELNEMINRKQFPTEGFKLIHIF